MNEVVLQVIGALSAGAIAAGTEVASDAVKSAYAALKSAVKLLVGDSLGDVDSVLAGKNDAQKAEDLERALVAAPAESISELSKQCELMKAEISKNAQLIETLKAKDEEVKASGVVNIVMRERSKFIYKVVELHNQIEVNLTGEKDAVFAGDHFGVTSKK